ncbi:MAG: acylphosphatase [Methylococcales bacterium]|nr:acylphosphatase [Methylococcales bacterium]
MKTVQLIISGRVQGVYFRMLTKKQADKLGITGFVRNKADGSVEVIANANDKNLNQFINWCHQGPMMAKVENVSISNYSNSEQFTGFEIR